MNEVFVDSNLGALVERMERLGDQIILSWQSDREKGKSEVHPIHDCRA